MRTFSGHTAFIQAVAFSPDGKLLASAGGDAAVRVWDVVQGRESRVLVMGDEAVGAVAFSPNSLSLAAGTHDGRIEQFDLELGIPQRSAWVGQGRVTALAYTPDGGSLAWSSYPGWRICPLSDYPPSEDPFAAKDQLFEEPLADTGLLFVLRISADGRLIATGGTGPAIHLYAAATGAEMAVLPHGDRQGVWSLAFSPDGRILAAALAGGVQLWDVPGERLLDQWQDHDDVVTGIVISADGRRLLTCSWDRTARLYEFDLSGKRGRQVGCYDWEIGSLFDVAISPDSTLAVAGGDAADYLVAWDVE